MNDAGGEICDSAHGAENYPIRLDYEAPTLACSPLAMIVTGASGAFLDEFGGNSNTET